MWINGGGRFTACAANSLIEAMAHQWRKNAIVPNVADRCEGCGSSIQRADAAGNLSSEDQPFSRPTVGLFLQPRLLAAG